LYCEKGVAFSLVPLIVSMMYTDTHKHTEHTVFQASFTDMNSHSVQGVLSKDWTLWIDVEHIFGHKWTPKILYIVFKEENKRHGVGLVCELGAGQETKRIHSNSFKLIQIKSGESKCQCYVLVSEK